MNNKYFEYTTLEGDTFDSIALKFLNNEFRSSEIMKLNPNYIDKIVFPSNINLKIPVIEEIKNSTLPPWKR